MQMTGHNKGELDRTSPRPAVDQKVTAAGSLTSCCLNICRAKTCDVVLQRHGKHDSVKQEETSALTVVSAQITFKRLSLLQAVVRVFSGPNQVIMWCLVTVLCTTFPTFPYLSHRTRMHAEQAALAHRGETLLCRSQTPQPTCERDSGLLHTAECCGFRKLAVSKMSLSPHTICCFGC